MVLVKIAKKNLVFAVGGCLLLFLGFFIGQRTKNEEKTIPPSIPIPTSLITTAPISSPVSETVKVIRVIDGDTIEIENGERVRYIGIDTPETMDPRKPVQCFGTEATKKNKELVEGKIVRLEKDVSNRDKYGRLLRYVYTDNLFVNLELVKQGFAFAYTYPPDVKYQTEILAGEKEARKANRGLWQDCPPTISIQDTPRNDCDIKGNISGSGEKIYHLSGCDSYAKTKIDESRGERWFCSEKEAQTAGWRKALNCP